MTISYLERMLVLFEDHMRANSFSESEIRTAIGCIKLFVTYLKSKGKIKGLKEL